MIEISKETFILDKHEDLADIAFFTIVNGFGIPSVVIVTEYSEHLIVFSSEHDFPVVHNCVSGNKKLTKIDEVMEKFFSSCKLILVESDIDLLKIKLAMG